MTIIITIENSKSCPEVLKLVDGTPQAMLLCSGGKGRHRGLLISYEKISLF